MAKIGHDEAFPIISKVDRPRDWSRESGGELGKRWRVRDLLRAAIEVWSVRGEVHELNVLTVTNSE